MSRKCPKETANRFYELAKKDNWTVNEPYQDSVTKISLTCPQGHHSPKTPNAFMRGFRCKICRTARKRELVIKQFHEFVNKKKWQVEGDYIDSITLIDLVCPNGHKQSKTPNQIKTFQFCPMCPKKSRKFYDALRF